MDVNMFNVNVCSEQPERLIEFYAEVVGLPRLSAISAGAFKQELRRCWSTATAA